MHRMLAAAAALAFFAMSGAHAEEEGDQEIDDVAQVARACSSLPTVADVNICRQTVFGVVAKMHAHIVSCQQLGATYSSLKFQARHTRMSKRAREAELRGIRRDERAARELCEVAAQNMALMVNVIFSQVPTLPKPTSDARQCDEGTIHHYFVSGVEITPQGVRCFRSGALVREVYMLASDDPGFGNESDFTLPQDKALCTSYQCLIISLKQRGILK